MEYLWKDTKRHLGLPISFTRYRLSEDRLFLLRGFLTQTEDEVKLFRVRDLSLTRTLWQRIFGVGTVKVISVDQTIPILLLENVAHSRDVKELISKTVEEARRAEKMRPTEFLGGSMEDQDGDGVLDMDDNP